jgi:hypothetical protein
VFHVMFEALEVCDNRRFTRISSSRYSRRGYWTNLIEVSSVRETSTPIVKLDISCVILRISREGMIDISDFKQLFRNTYLKKFKYQRCPGRMISQGKEDCLGDEWLTVDEGRVLIIEVLEIVYSKVYDLI